MLAREVDYLLGISFERHSDNKGNIVPKVPRLSPFSSMSRIDCDDDPTAARAHLLEPVRLFKAAGYEMRSRASAGR